MKYWVGIDLGSTTTKAVVLGEGGDILGRGITNSRSNYKVACDVALGEALINARFGLLVAELDRAGMAPEPRDAALEELGRRFREQQYRAQLRALAEAIQMLAGGGARGSLPVLGATGGNGGGGAIKEALDAILGEMDGETRDLYGVGASRKSDFFRDLAGSRYLALADEASRETGASFDRLAGFFDKAILQVENLSSGADDFQAHVRAALGALDSPVPELPGAVDAAAGVALEETAGVGTGYGRQTLPFPKEQIRSEILCHGLGAHAMFPETRTVLDIGGQDTKAIQVDGEGIVTSFQMNDRCAAGCGRYLGYIADEMNLGVHELGPMASRSRRTVRINSTCTVFAGAELRERLSLGEKREDILAGLHRAIILRAMSLLARSGGVTDEFTFTGGVARNEAAVAVLEQLIQENYGNRKMNISPDSIYTGALGAALFSRRDSERGEEDEGRSERMSAAAGERLRVAGIDVGSSAVKVVILETDGEDDTRVLAGLNERIRRRDPQQVVDLVIAQSLEQAGVRPGELAYIATTGEGEMVASRTGHFYGMTTHARGGLFLDPEARAIIDIGALHARAVLFDDRAKVLGYRMTSQCASGSGQFLENICRYLGVSIDEIGPLSLEADAPEACSSICAVLAETDVINMVSRGISTSNIIKGIHQSMAGRYIRLISSAGSGAVVLVTGGLATDVGLVAALQEAAVAGKTPVEIRSHKNSVLAGALGAALWGAFRTRKLARDGVSFTAPQSAHQHGGRDATDHTG